jgi:LAO/AO transport system kinase
VELIDAIERHRAYLLESGMLSQRAQRQVRSEVQALLIHAMMEALHHQVSEDEWRALIEEITTRERDPYSVAQELQEKIGLK